MEIGGDILTGGMGVSTNVFSFSGVPIPRITLLGYDFSATR